MRELVIQIDAETAERLERLSFPGQASAEEIALAAIVERIQELEDLPTALERLREIEEGMVEPIPHARAMRNLGLGR